MTTTEGLVSTDEIETTTPTPVRTRRMFAIGAAAIVTVAAFAAFVTKTDQERTPQTPPTSAVSMDEKLQDLVDRGLIPRQALQPAPLTMEQKLQDLVDRGLIPRQALEQAPAPRSTDQAADFGTQCVETRWSGPPHALCARRQGVG